jgi:hypothetical protein
MWTIVAEDVVVTPRKKSSTRIGLEEETSTADFQNKIKQKRRRKSKLGLEAKKRLKGRRKLPGDYRKRLSKNLDSIMHRYGISRRDLARPDLAINGGAKELYRLLPRNKESSEHDKHHLRANPEGYIEIIEALQKITGISENRIFHMATENISLHPQGERETDKETDVLDLLQNLVRYLDERFDIFRLYRHTAELYIDTTKSKDASDWILGAVQSVTPEPGSLYWPTGEPGDESFVLEELWDALPPLLPHAYLGMTIDHALHKWPKTIIEDRHRRLEAWRTMRKYINDPGGFDWREENGKLRPILLSGQTPEEFNNDVARARHAVLVELAKSESSDEWDMFIREELSEPETWPGMIATRWLSIYPTPSCTGLLPVLLLCPFAPQIAVIQGLSIQTLVDFRQVELISPTGDSVFDRIQTLLFTPVKEGAEETFLEEQWSRTARFFENNDVLKSHLEAKEEKESFVQRMDQLSKRWRS